VMIFIHIKLSKNHDTKGFLSKEIIAGGF
jgi:hypothetical protein